MFSKKAILSIMVLTTFVTSGLNLFVGAVELDTIDKASTMVTGKLNAPYKEKDITISFQQPETLSVTLSTDTVNFGLVSGVDETERLNDVNVTVSSSLPYNIDIKASKDIVGSNPSNIIDVSKISVKADSGGYVSMNKGFSNLVNNSPQTVSRIHNLSFKLGSTIGAKSDSYSVPLVLRVNQP